jgi:hypothetical protein
MAPKETSARPIIGNGAKRNKCPSKHRKSQQEAGTDAFGRIHTDMIDNYSGLIASTFLIIFLFAPYYISFRSLSYFFSLLIIFLFTPYHISFRSLLYFFTLLIIKRASTNLQNLNL